MIIWTIAILLLALFGWVGYQQGAIRAAVSFIGILVAGVLAMKVSGFIKPVIGFLGFKHPLTQQLIAPIVTFIIVWVVFQLIAYGVNEKIELFYKYKKDDKTRIKWERLNERLGICIGFLSATALFTLMMIPVYLFGYLTSQIASGEGDPASLRIINTARTQLHSTGFDRVVAAYDPAKDSVYDAFDVIGIVYKNPESVSLLARYPSFVTLAERPEFQQIANDSKFHNLWQSGASIGELLDHPQAQAISTNATLMDEIQAVLIPDLQDLKQYLLTGESPKYGEEKILGRWDFDFAGTINYARKNKPGMQAPELRQLRANITPFYGGSLIATIDNKVILKRGEQTANTSLPRVIAEGSWKREAGLYQVTIDNRTIEVVVEDGNKLVVPWGAVNLIYIREFAVAK